MAIHSAYKCAKMPFCRQRLQFYVFGNSVSVSHFSFCHVVEMLGLEMNATSKNMAGNSHSSKVFGAVKFTKFTR